jgi:hypothetical protein
MTLALLVYLVSVVPTFGTLLTISSIVLMAIFGLRLIGALIDLDVYVHRGEEDSKVFKARSTLILLQRKIWIPICLVVLACLIPSKTTIYTMIVAYAGQTIAETPQAQQISNDAVDVLHELLAKAKRELKVDESKTEGK